jgi:hypothetical protein
MGGVGSGSGSGSGGDVIPQNIGGVTPLQWRLSAKISTKRLHPPQPFAGAGAAADSGSVSGPVATSDSSANANAMAVAAAPNPSFQRSSSLVLPRTAGSGPAAGPAAAGGAPAATPSPPPEVTVLLEKQKRELSHMRKKLGVVEHDYDALKSEMERRFGCPICFSSAKDQAFIPCGHVVCRTCAGATKDQCPLCGAPAAGCVAIYL